MNDLNAVDWIALILVIVGAVNWGLVGLFKFNLVRAIFGEDTTLSRFIYILVGVSGVYLVYLVTQLSRQ